MKSPKEIALDKKILSMLSGKALKAAEIMLRDEEIKNLQDYANAVSIKRLGYNDHGPVHMRMVVINSLIMLDLLNRAGVKLNLEKEGAGNFEDSRIAVLFASFLHDIGMSVGRENHEYVGITLATPMIDRILSQVYREDLKKKVIVRSLALEGIAGHMGTSRIHSLEAGVVLIADGCDMEKGRARIPLILSTESRVGDIHKYSSSSIDEVKIEKGENRPIRITVKMSESVGFFQIEGVLFKKINSSPVKPHIELYAGVTGEKMKCYL